MKIVRPRIYTTVEQYPEFECPPFADTLKFPNDLTVLDSTNISKLLGQFTAMLAWASQLKTKTEQSLLVVRAQINERKTQILSQDHTLRNNSQRWRIDFVLDTDQFVQLQTKRQLSLERAKLGADNMVANFERFITALSRELSRKMASRDGLAYERNFNTEIVARRSFAVA